MTPSHQSFLKLANNPFKFGIYLLFRLPAAFFSGIRIREINEKRCVASVPYKWLTQNPFHSTYFASLAMAAEMSTGILASANVHRRIPAISMLVTKMEAAYFKKATGSTFFTCEDGNEMTQTIDEAIANGEAKTIIAKSIGMSKNGELIAEFSFTWSFKVKSRKQ